MAIKYRPKNSPLLKCRKNRLYIDRFKKFLTGTHSGKLAIKPSLKIQPHLKHVATYTVVLAKY